MIVITQRRQLGKIGDHIIYGVDKSQLITIPHSSVQSDVSNSGREVRYKSINPLESRISLFSAFFN